MPTPALPWVSLNWSKARRPTASCARPSPPIPGLELGAVLAMVRSRLNISDIGYWFWPEHDLEGGGTAAVAILAHLELSHPWVQILSGACASCMA